MLNKDDIKKIVDEHFFGNNSIENLIEKLKKEGDSWFGSFNPPFTDRERVLQSIGQSAFIRYGDAIALSIVKICENSGWKTVTRKIKSENYPGKKDKTLDIDLFVAKENTAYVCEVKIRDNHDNTKAEGQLEDFIRKVKAVKNNYSNYEVVGIIYYVDPSLKKHGEKIIDFASENNKDLSLRLCYGKDFFELLSIDTQWEVFSSALDEWRNERQPLMNTYEKLIKTNYDNIKLKIQEYKEEFQNPRTFKKILELIENFLVV